MIVDNLIKTTEGTELLLSKIHPGQVIWTLDRNKEIVQTTVLNKTLMTFPFIVSLKVKCNKSEHTITFLPTDKVYSYSSNKIESWTSVADIEIGDLIYCISISDKQDYCEVIHYEFISEESSGYNLQCYPEDSFLYSQIDIWTKSKKLNKLSRKFIA